MTDTSTTTPDQQPEPATADVPDIGYSTAELQYLLSIAPGPAADMSAEFFGVAPVPSVDETILTGGAALLARGHLEFLDGGEFKPVDEALVVAYILTNATRWSTITGADGDTEGAADLGVFVESPSGGLLAQPRTLGTWWFVILDPAAEPGEVIIGSSMGLANQFERSGVVVQTATLEHDRTFSLRRDGDEWGYAYGNSRSEQPEKLAETAPLEEVITELASFVAYFPNMQEQA